MSRLPMDVIHRRQTKIPGAGKNARRADQEVGDISDALCLKVLPAQMPWVPLD